MLSADVAAALFNVIYFKVTHNHFKPYKTDPPVFVRRKKSD